MAQSLPVQDFDPDEIPRIQLQQTYDDDTTKKMEVPIIDGRLVEAALYSLNEFYEAAKELSFDTDDELFRYFCHILRSTIKDDRDGIVNDNGFAGIVNENPADFEICIQEWKLTFVTKDSRQTLIDYLLSVTKHRAMTVKSFVQRLKTMAQYIEVLPHTDPILPILMMTQIKNIIYRAMPAPWQVHFVRSHSGIANVTLLELQNFMANEKTFAGGSFEHFLVPMIFINSSLPGGHLRAALLRTLSKLLPGLPFNIFSKARAIENFHHQLFFLFRFILGLFSSLQLLNQDLCKSLFACPFIRPPDLGKHFAFLRQITSNLLLNLELGDFSEVSEEPHDFGGVI
jgi:hypothetical protein